MATENINIANRRLVTRLSLVVIGMFGFGFALVPLYQAFCDITGLNGKTGRLEAAAVQAVNVDESRLVSVEFVAHVSSELPWDFRPMVHKMTVHPGEVAEARYFAVNHSASPVNGQAIPSVVPGRASKYFNKTECFCFTQQTLGPGEEREMVIRFIVDPELPEEIGSIALSYTFFKAKDS